MFDTVTHDLDSRELAADAIVTHRRELLRVGAERLALAAHWCDLHPADQDRRGARLAGADGTPEVTEFAAEELGCHLGVHTHTAWVLIADAVNLRHRHPQLWAKTMAGDVVDWVARKAASKVAAAQLTLEQARWVDEVTSPYAGTLTPGRYLALVEAKIIEADPDAAEARALARALERFVRTGAANEHGIGTLVARATAGDIIVFVALVNRIAQILELQGDDDLVDVRRSKAIGILADPARALALLEWTPTSQAKPPKPLPKAVLNIHIAHESLLNKQGVARVEDLGPVTMGQVCEWLRHCNVVVKPVIDLAGGMPVDCYEIPTRMHDVIKLRQPFEIFPWGTINSRRADDDHSKPYVPPDRGGPPGQTHPDNLGPLGRRKHRVKTHAPGWRHHQLHPGTYLWRTPTGHWYRVNRSGSHHLGRHVSLLEEQLRALVSR
ncbi:MAG TPA: hypothetical protein VLI04_07725 [Nocardioidaceae bacterium]|nr:hypothetical protein [Nocardioidaceae bacterium]